MCLYDCYSSDPPLKTIITCNRVLIHPHTPQTTPIHHQVLYAFVCKGALSRTDSLKNDNIQLAGSHAPCKLPMNQPYSFAGLMSKTKARTITRPRTNKLPITLPAALAFCCISCSFIFLCQVLWVNITSRHWQNLFPMCEDLSAIAKLIKSL